MAKKHNIYLINKEKVPSVTTILNEMSKPGLEIWYGKLGLKEANRQKEEAAAFGSSVHSAIEAICNGQTALYSDERLKTAVNNFRIWADTFVEEWVVFEKAVFHDDLKYAGTADAYAILKGSKKMVLVDFKTSKKVRDEYYLQVAAYMNCNRIEDDCVDLKKVEGAIIVHLDHDSLTWESVHAHVTPYLFDVFKACLTIYKWRNPKS